MFLQLFKLMVNLMGYVSLTSVPKLILYTQTTVRSESLSKQLGWPGNKCFRRFAPSNGVKKFKYNQLLIRTFILNDKAPSPLLRQNLTEIFIFERIYLLPHHLRGFINHCAILRCSCFFFKVLRWWWWGIKLQKFYFVINIQPMMQNAIMQTQNLITKFHKRGEWK